MSVFARMAAALRSDVVSGSLLVAELSGTDTALLTDAKGAVLLASAVASLLALAVLGVRNRHYRRPGGHRGCLSWIVRPPAQRAAARRWGPPYPTAAPLPTTVPA